MADEGAGIGAGGRAHPHIGIGDRETAAEFPGQRAPGETACESAVAGTLEARVPAGLGHPKLNSDVGVGGGRQRSRHPAECGQVRDRLARREV